MHAGENPFSVQRIHSLPYVFDDGDGLAGLAGQFWQAVCRGQRRQAICGGHGSGKSTLLRELGLYFQRTGTDVLWLDAQSQPGEVFGTLGSLGTSLREARFQGVDTVDGNTRRGLSVVLVDSGERYSWWEWQRICWRYRGRALLTTSHRREWLPMLYWCRPSFATFSRLCNTLWDAKKQPLKKFIDHKSLAELYERHDGDLRQCFFELYSAAAD